MDSRRANAVLVSIIFPSFCDGDAECFLHMAVRDCERADFVHNSVGIPCYRIFCDGIGNFIAVCIKQRHTLKGILPILCITQCCFRRRTIRTVQVDSNTVRAHAINIVTVVPDLGNRKVVKLRNMFICNGDSIAVVNGTCCSAYRSGITIHRVLDDSILDCLSFIISGNRTECVSQISIRCFEQCGVRFLERNCFCFAVRQCNGTFQCDDCVLTNTILVIGVIPFLGDCQVCGFACIFECVQIVGLADTIYRNIGLPDKVIVLDPCFRHDLDNMSLCVPHIAGQSLCFGQMIGGDILICKMNQTIFISNKMFRLSKNVIRFYRRCCVKLIRIIRKYRFP